MQEYLQQGIPVVARFLSEYLIHWDGKELFMDVVGLISYVQITDFVELKECLLAPFLSHFDSTFDMGQRTLFLYNLQMLVVHWIQSEYARCKNHQKRVFGTANPDCRWIIWPF